MYVIPKEILLKKKLSLKLFQFLKILTKKRQKIITRSLDVCKKRKIIWQGEKTPKRKGPLSSNDSLSLLQILSEQS